MKIIVHNLYDDSNATFEGDRTTIFRDIAREYPWLTEHIPPGDMDTLVEHINAQQFLMAEVADISEHPLEKLK